MNRTVIPSLVFSIFALAGCERGPEATCDSYVKLAKGDWPAGDDVKKECTKELTALKERKPEAYTCAQKCVSTTFEGTLECIEGACSFYDDDKSADLWRFGFANDSAGRWADEKPKKLTEEECREGAFAIAANKVKLGVIEKKDRGPHRADLFKACKTGKDDATYAKSFACLRRVTKRDQILDCSPPSLVSAPGGVSAAKIESCVSECTDKHGRDANAAYMSCFNQCKAR